MQSKSEVLELLLTGKLTAENVANNINQKDIQLYQTLKRKAYAQFERGENTIEEENELEENFYSIFKVITETYLLKKVGIFHLLLKACNSSYFKNWGIISDTLEDSRVILGFDFEGWNMPLTVHIDTESLKCFFKYIHKQGKIRRYIGDNDWYINGKRWTTSIFMPVKYPSTLKAENEKLAEHLKFLTTGKWPTKLKEELKKPGNKYLVIS